MKKLNLLLIVALLASALLAASPAKLVRLDVNNKSGDTVYLKLEGALTDSFYYLTIPDGGWKSFTILSDYYNRTTWACGGVKSTGKLVVTGNIRLTFVACNTIPLTWRWIDVDGDGFGARIYGVIPLLWVDPDDLYVRVVNQGEPTMEKVVYFTFYTGAYWTFNCGFWSVFQVKVKIPVGCYFRYRY